MYLMKTATTYFIWHHNVTICLLDLEIFTGRVIILSHANPPSESSVTEHHVYLSNG